MDAKVRKLHPKAHDRIAETLQYVLDLPLGLSPGTKGELTQKLGEYSPDPWVYFMTHSAGARSLVHYLQSSREPRKASLYAVWLAALSYAAWGGECEIMATRKQLAADTCIPEREVSRNLSRLAELGALRRLGRGRYAMNPNMNWNGPLAGREQAERKLRLVER